MGLRELKKEQTRRLIADTAWRLFTERGFDQVSVAEVAREAQVAEATVFNYFPAKEDLFYWRLQSVRAPPTDPRGAPAPGRPARGGVREGHRRGLRTARAGPARLRRRLGPGAQVRGWRTKCPWPGTLTIMPSPLRISRARAATRCETW